MSKPLHELSREEIIQKRMEDLTALRANPTDFIKRIKHYREGNYADFICDYMLTYDPRKAPSELPFVLYPRQREYIDWLYARWRGKEDGLVEKSRDTGLTWLCCAFAVCIWLFEEGQTVSFGSRKEDLVDKIGDPDCIFEKMRIILRNLPNEFLPTGYNEKKNATFLKIINPGNGTIIKGEAGDNIGRGGRSSIYFKDEALPLSAKVLTPSGWATMEELQIGDLVVGVDGLPTNIIGVNNCGEYDVYRFHFSDGTSAESSGGHIWTVEKFWGKKLIRNMRTEDIFENYKHKTPKGQTQYKYRIPVCRPVYFNFDDKLPLNPYIVGALLGDGCVTVAGGTPRITTADHEVVEQFEKFLPEEAYLSYDGNYGYRIVGGLGKGKSPRGKNNIFKNKLIESGIYGMYSGNKKIPTAYKYSSISNRISLLQGLLDTDGSGSGGVVSFHSTSKELSDDVRFITQSLGGTATHNIKEDKRGFKPVHVLHLALPEQFLPFRIQRKLDSIRKRKHPFGRTIVGVERIERQKVKCISVGSKDGLYLINDFIVTHNSAFYERPDKIEAALSQNSDVKIDVSTPNGTGNPFYRKRHGGQIPVFTFHWKDDPRKTQAWYENQKRILDPIILAQEVDIDYTASVKNNLIDGTSVQNAMHMKVEFEIMGPKILGVDPARYGNDRTAYVMRQGRVVHWIRTDRQKSTMEIVGQVSSWMNDYWFDAVMVDVIGLGAGIYDALAERWGERIIPVSSSETADDPIQYYNKRIEMWCAMRDWLKMPEVSLPNDSELIVDLTAPQYLFNSSGQRQLEKKEDMRRRGVKSPDIGDALAMTFAEEVTYYSDEDESIFTSHSLSTGSGGY